jgi:hypothetical protein
METIDCRLIDYCCSIPLNQSFVLPDFRWKNSEKNTKNTVAFDRF